MAEKTPQRIEPARLEETSEAIADVIADLSAASAKLGVGLHPRTAASLADLVRLMNTYYSNLIEGITRVRTTSFARSKVIWIRTTGAGIFN
jgi:Fic family protein